MHTHAPGAAARILLLAALSPAVVPAQERPQDPPQTISLTEAQKRILQTLEAESGERAAALLLRLPETAKRFNTNLLAATPDPELDRKLGREMADTFAEAIQLRIARIRSAAKALTPEQRLALVAELKNRTPPTCSTILSKECWAT